MVIIQTILIIHGIAFPFHPPSSAAKYLLRGQKAIFANINARNEMCVFFLQFLRVSFMRTLYILPSSRPLIITSVQNIAFYPALLYHAAPQPSLSDRAYQ